MNIKLGFFLLTSLFVMSSQTLAAPQSEIDAIKKAVESGYQSQRNLAFEYSRGWGDAGDSDYVPKDIIKSCAWRKIIVLSNHEKLDVTDYSNESIDCKNVHPVDNEKVWQLVFAGLSLIEQAKNTL
ncbi:TPA_asm: hypothetical protein GNB58_003843 [Salmonella enterica subsp. houtenae serovar 45:g,z51:-]|uniref:Uncharacterized protein n=1 Tax=Salmonella enterica subsp. houtenae serovar 45:g,z51:- TaxID=1967611 RepID=A0A736VBT4_SALHO|nr:hypothetical protein [Salmonella enterica subsp. houtenae str. CFSAN000557]HAE7766803.1 hypothetical protein [Salmonella enterica subsp. houtenae serovar 45:g,z51:-]